MVAPTLVQVNQLVADCSPFGNTLFPGSSTIQIAFRTFQISHFYFSTTENYRSWSTNKGLIGLGAGCHIALGGNNLKAIAKWILIARAIMRCHDAQKELIDAYRRVVAIWNEEHPLPVQYLKDKGALAAEAPSYSQLLITTMASWPSSIFRFIYQARNFAKENILLASKAALLSARLHELTQAIFVETPFEQVVGVFANGKETIQRLTQNRIILLQEVSQHQRLIDSISKCSGSTVNSKDLGQILIRSEDTYERYNRICTNMLKVTVETGATAMYLLTGTLLMPATKKSKKPSQPYFKVLEFHDYISPILGSDSPCKTRPWNPNGRFYLSN